MKNEKLIELLDCSKRDLAERLLYAYNTISRLEEKLCDKNNKSNLLSIHIIPPIPPIK